MGCIDMKEERMNPILEGTSGDAVEDIQDRLKHLGYQIDDEECDDYEDDEIEGF